MFGRLMIGPLRFVVYLFVIAGVVAGGVYYLLDDNLRQHQMGAGGAAASPPPPWKRTERAVADANEDFHIESSAEGNHALRGSVQPDSWPTFNGAQRDNCSSSTGLLETWPEGGPPLLWKTRGLGNGYSSVAVVDGVVYTMGNKAESEALFALDAGTGEKIWSTPFARASRPSNGPGPRCTPTVSQGAVFAVGAEGEIVCADAKTGSIRWQLNFLKEFGSGVPTWGICESILIDGNKLICTPGGSKATIACLDAQSGKPIWISQIANESLGYASTVMAEVGGVRQYIQFLNGGTVGVRADDGVFLWRNNDSSSGTANCSSPLVSGDLVFSASGYGKGGALLKLSSSNRTTSAELVYHTQNMKNHHGDMAIIDGMLFGSNDPGILVCMDLMTGKVKWQNRSVGKGAITYADGRIYLRGELREVALIEATGDGYHELGRFDQPDRSNEHAWSHPVVSHNRLFLRDQGLLLCYDLKRDH